jgi:hypothetical protein
MTVSVLDAFNASLYFASRAVTPSVVAFIGSSLSKHHYRSGASARLAGRTGKAFSEFGTILPRGLAHCSKSGTLIL